MNAPKRIVAVLDDAGCGECFVNEGQIYEYEIPYIRADLVDALVEALNHWKNAKTLASMHLEMENFEAALKALEENNE
jgi:hypothetical protein